MFFFMLTNSMLVMLKKLKTEPEEVEAKEFKEDKKALVPSRPMLYCPP
jgi:hypothetical protein